MNSLNLQHKTQYKIKTASCRTIINHLKKCTDGFIPPLHTYVNIDEYGRKIFNESTTFEAWGGNNLIGLLAAYFNKNDTKVGFITNISVLKKYQGYGIASRLMKRAIDYGEINNFVKLTLEIRSENKRISQLYKKFGFIVIEEKKNTIIMSNDLVCNKNKQR
jgi:ribosomal protein S18 acetylase RimI-like enzyme